MATIMGLAKDLPVTEYWDLDWDVYDVQPYPDENVPFELWWRAYEHTWLLGWIMSGTAAYIPAHFNHQLTTGRG